MQLTKNFKKEELQCPCCGRCEMSPKLLTLLQALRDDVGFSLIINSGFRCENHNKELVFSSSKSQHLLGKAVDVSTKTLTGEQKHRLLTSVFKNGFKGVGVYSTFIHVDVREIPVFFTKLG